MRPFLPGDDVGEEDDEDDDELEVLSVLVFNWSTLAACFFSAGLTVGLFCLTNSSTFGAFNLVSLKTFLNSLIDLVFYFIKCLIRLELMILFKMD